MRPHRSGVWTISIGCQVSKDRTKLIRKDWYFRTTQKNANLEAAKIQRQWIFIAEHWQAMYQGTLEAVGNPFAAIPHWQPAVTPGKEPSAEDVEQATKFPPTPEEIFEAYENTKLKSICAQDHEQQRIAVGDGEKKNVTKAAIFKNIRCGLYIEEKLPLKFLNLPSIAECQNKHVEGPVGENGCELFSAVKSMLDWFMPVISVGDVKRQVTTMKCLWSKPKSKKIVFYAINELKKLDGCGK